MREVRFDTTKNIINLLRLEGIKEDKYANKLVREIVENYVLENKRRL